MPAPETEPTPRESSAWFAPAASGLLSGALFLMPNLLATVLAPVPLLIGHRRFGRQHGMQAAGFGLATVTSLALLAGAGSSGSAAILLGYLLGPALIAVGLAWAVRVSANGAAALVLGVAGYLGFLAALMGAYGLLMPGSLASQVSGWVDGSFIAFTEAAKEQAARDAQLAQVLMDLQQRREEYRRWSVLLLPSITASVVAMGFWLNLVYTRWFVGGKNETDDLSLWRLPHLAILLFMGCTAGVVTQVDPLGIFFPRSEALLAASINGLIFLGALYWLQGVAVVNHWFIRLPIGPVVRLLGVAAQVLTMMFPPTSALYGATGLFDAWFDVRRLDGEELD